MSLKISKDYIFVDVGAGILFMITGKDKIGFKEGENHLWVRRKPGERTYVNHRLYHRYLDGNPDHSVKMELTE